MRYNLGLCDLALVSSKLKGRGKKTTELLNKGFDFRKANFQK